MDWEDEKEEEFHPSLPFDQWKKKSKAEIYKEELEKHKKLPWYKRATSKPNIPDSYLKKTKEDQRRKELELKSLGKALQEGHTCNRRSRIQRSKGRKRGGNKDLI